MRTRLVTRRAFLSRLATTSVGAVALTGLSGSGAIGANGSIVARSLQTFLERTIFPNATRLEQAAVSAPTQQRILQARQLLVERNTRLSETAFGRYTVRGPATGGPEPWQVASRQAILSIGDGWGVLQGSGRLRPSVEPVDTTFATFPNHGNREVALLGCPEISVLGLLPDLALRSYRGRGFDVGPALITGMIFPLFGLERPRYDDVWNSLTPTLYASGGFIIRFITRHAGTGRAEVECTTWLNKSYGGESIVPLTQRAPEYQETYPLGKVFRE